MMRDNHSQLPEIVETVAEGSQLFGIVRMNRDDKNGDFRIGLHQDEYRAWNKVLQTYPFDPLNRNPCRYFFSPCASRRDGKTFGKIRIEQDSDGREFEMELPQRMIANLMWFFELADLADAFHLALEPINSEQGGAGQTATRSESK